jgi:hypothetical protein
VIAQPREDSRYRGTGTRLTGQDIRDKTTGTSPCDPGIVVLLLDKSVLLLAYTVKFLAEPVMLLA